MQLSTAQDLRPHIKKFYQALKANDVAFLKDQKSHGFPLEWVQTFAEVSLPEYAMQNNAVEAAWWLMAEGVMPEKWSVFTGAAWTGFLKKGLQLALSGSGSAAVLPMEAYKNILKIALITTGEKAPAWLETFWVGSGVKGLFSAIKTGASDALNQARERAREAQATQSKDTLQSTPEDKTPKARKTAPKNQVPPIRKSKPR